MSVTAHEGIVENGHIRLPENVQLPEQTRVVVVVSRPGAAMPAAHLRSPRLAVPEQASDFVLQVVDLNR